MNTICLLSELPLQKNGLIKKVDCSANLKNRMFDMGIIENTVITPIYRSPFGDPTAFLVKNALIALRECDCKDIIVTIL